MGIITTASAPKTLTSGTDKRKKKVPKKEESKKYRTRMGIGKPGTKMLATGKKTKGKKRAKSTLTGQAGKAERAIKARKKRLDKAAGY